MPENETIPTNELLEEPITELCPEQALWLHVLHMAIYDAAQANVDAIEWIFKPSRIAKCPTFNWVCQTLWLDPEQIRFRISERIHCNVPIRNRL